MPPGRFQTASNVPLQRSFQRQMEGLEKFMANAYTNDHNVVVLLDDAQLMNPEALEVLHRLYNFDYDAKVVQVLAFGQSEMTSVFETNKSVNARVFVRLALPPLTLSSALQMVLFRLRVAGPLGTDDQRRCFRSALRKIAGRAARDHPPVRAFHDRLLQGDESMINVEIAREVI